MRRDRVPLNLIVCIVLDPSSMCPFLLLRCRVANVIATLDNIILALHSPHQIKCTPSVNPFEFVFVLHIGHPCNIESTPYLRTYILTYVYG